MLPEEPPPSAPSPPPLLADSITPDQDKANANSGEIQPLVIMTKALKIPPNSFGISKVYPTIPTPASPMGDSNPYFCLPHTSLSSPIFPHHPLGEIIHPYPNLSSWRFAHHHWMGLKSKSLEDWDTLQTLITHPDFNATDLLEGIDAYNWDPSGVKQTQAVKKAAAAVAQIAATTKTPVEINVEGHCFNVPGFWYHSITQVIVSVFGHNTSSKNFHFHPFKKTYQ
ncbi:hypothetical protein JAAARDRAFT_193724 [Jaapia argillacea MUCL 33604]|uniref:Uncharacterized protein n=1 Tax=Jaapia argillacea MUCL 33604 TaxID=933084 RepID=A0A067PU73_9AGAM|nr:hypothetical protein JAAARDRAFT_193724 [Jaapia argillacea MUCL 33604]